MEIKLSTPADKNLFKKLLSENILTFEYRKLDGTKRNSRGTLHYSYVPKTNKSKDPKGEIVTTNNAKPEQVTYWDFSAGGWRSPRLIGQTIIIKNIEPINKTEDRILKINNRLFEIYEQRETIKKEIKAIKKELNKTTKINVMYIGELVVHDVEKINIIKEKLNNFEEERKMLRREVERLQNLKYKINN